MITNKAKDFFLEVRVDNDPIANPPDVPNGTQIFWNDGGGDRIYFMTSAAGPVEFKLPGLVSDAFFPCDQPNNEDSYEVDNVGGTGRKRLSFVAPADFDSLISLDAIVIVDGPTGLQDFDLISHYALAGEDKLLNSQTVVGHQIDFTGLGDQHYNFDISFMFPNLAAEHRCGMDINHKGIGGALDYLGIVMKYQKTP